jgi:hypothetical protein
MFRFRKSEFEVDWEQPPWWQVISPRGWGVLFLAVFSTLSFVVGLVSGEALLVISYKQKSGPGHAAYQASPVWFIICMAINAAISIGLWALFSSWLRDRRNATKKPPISRLMQNALGKEMTPNPSIERTNNGGSGLRAFVSAQPPLFASHLKR